MISDEERREVAKRLRRELDYMRERRAWYRSNVDAVECGNTAYRNIAASAIPYGNIGSDYIGVVEHLADLIDRPTCHNASGHQDMSAQMREASKRGIEAMKKRRGYPGRPVEVDGRRYESQAKVGEAVAYRGHEVRWLA